MATKNIPPALKTPDITRFVLRAAQVEKVKPAVAYWCYYYVLDKILGAGLHKTDEQCSNYVVSLMDKVEQMKNDNPEDDAIRDETAAKAYMEQFGTETFLRADNAVRANKASRATAETFQAASTFLDVLHVWPPCDPEIVSKIKYAKYHAVRIMKAIKAGEDPNDSNPMAESDDAAAPALDLNDPEVQAIAGIASTNESSPGLANDGGGPPQFVDQPPVSPQEGPISLPPYPNENSSKTTQPMPHHNTAEDFYSKPSNPDVSPLPASEGGGYFPQVPEDISVASPSVVNQPAPPAWSAPSLPGAPENKPGYSHSPALSQTPSSAPFNQFQPPAQTSSAGYQSPALSSPAFRPPPAQVPPPAAPPVQPYVPAAAEVNDEAMARAQKHARFAISALNFEDVNTAVKELRAALADLGQR